MNAQASLVKFRPGATVAVQKFFGDLANHFKTLNGPLNKFKAKRTYDLINGMYDEARYILNVGQSLAVNLRAGQELTDEEMSIIEFGNVFLYFIFMGVNKGYPKEMPSNVQFAIQTYVNDLSEDAKRNINKLGREYCDREGVNLSF